MSIAGELAVKVTADTNRLAKDLNDQTTRAGGQAATGFGSTFTAGLKKVAIAAGGILAVGKVASFMQESALLAEAANTANSRLAEALANAGEAAGAATGRQQELAEAISKATGIQDEQIKAGQAVLATFHQVAASAGDMGGTMDRATQAAVDMSAAGFGSVESASLQLGKALNDPIAGITALNRSGVTFTDAQKDLVKAMVESGDVAGAQALILGEVESQVGGIAEATADTSAIMAVEWQNAKESIGQVLLPVMEALAGFVTDTLVPAITGFAGWVTDTMVPALKDLADWFERNQTPIKIIAGLILAVLAPAFAVLAARALITAARVAASWAIQTASAMASKAAQIATMIAIGLKFAWLGVQALVNAARIAAAWLIAMGPVGWVIAAIVALIGVFVWAWNNVDWFREAVLTAWQWIKDAVAAVVDWFTGTLLPVLQSVWDGIAAGLSALWDIVSFIIALWLAIWITIFEAIKAVIETVWGFIGPFIMGALEAVIGFVKTWVGKLLAIWDGIKAVVSTVVGWMTGLWNTITDWLGRIVGKVKEWVGDFLRPFTDLAGDIVQKGKDLITGFWDGIKSMGTWLVTKLRDWIADKIPGPIASVLGIASPSKVMAEYGMQVAAGLQVGMQAGSRKVENAAAGLAAATIPGKPPIDLAAAATPTGTPLTTPLGGADGQPTIKVYIGDQELRGMVRTEYGEQRRRDALTRSMGGGV